MTTKLSNNNQITVPKPSILIHNTEEDEEIDRFYNPENDPMILISEIDIDNVRHTSEIDVVFLVDVTGSMNVYIKEVRRMIKKIVWEIQKLLMYYYMMEEEDVLKVGLVVYRDHKQNNILSTENSMNLIQKASTLPKKKSVQFSSSVQDSVGLKKDYKEESNNIVSNIGYEDKDNVIEVMQNLTADIDHFIEKLLLIKCSGGGDEPEAVVDGLNAAVNFINWRENSVKIIYHFLDSPGHGREISACSEDKFELFCPCKMKFEDILLQIRNNDIAYKVVKLSDSIDQMLQFFMGVTDFDVIIPEIEAEENKRIGQSS